MMDWNRQDHFPKRDSLQRGWLALNKDVITEITEKDISVETRKGSLISEPNSQLFLPAAFTIEGASSLLRSFKLAHLTIVWTGAVFGLIFLSLDLYAWTIDSKFKIYTGPAFLLLSSVYLLDYLLSVRHSQSIKERSLFLYYLKTSPVSKFGLTVWVSVGLAMWLSQLLFESVGGNGFLVYGVMYQDVANGGWWRLITGNFLHYSAFHFFTNFALLIPLGVVSWCVFQKNSLLIFIIGGLFGSYIQFYIGSKELDNCGGASFGLYALWGAISGSGLIAKSLLPRHLWVTLLWMAIASILGIELFSNTSATSGHFGGLFIGFAAGILYARLTLSLNQNTNSNTL